jgi:hypothetical protein
LPAPLGFRGADWGVDYLKEDSCNATQDHPTAFYEVRVCEAAAMAVAAAVNACVCAVVRFRVQLVVQPCGKRGPNAVWQPWLGPPCRNPLPPVRAAPCSLFCVCFRLLCSTASCVTA